MRRLDVLSLLCIASSFLQLVFGSCDISAASADVDFPNIEKDGVESFQLTVEYTIPGKKQTDYFTEYYDLVERQGRVDAFAEGKSMTYIYKTQTNEAWDISDRTCETEKMDANTPEMMREDMTDWRYTFTTGEEDDDSELREKYTFGPSAMFKYASDTWKSKDRSSKMAYMGVAEFAIRGLNAQFWRKCVDRDNFIDYFFTVDNTTDPDEINRKTIPLRVFFGGKDGDGEEAKTQQYEIITFQPSTSKDLFQIPKGLGCKRTHFRDAPKLPHFEKMSLQFGAEVIYMKESLGKTIKSGSDSSSYYSTIAMAFDVQSDHIAYYYAPWDTEKAKDVQEDPMLTPKYVIYDVKHDYAYDIDQLTGKCKISRKKKLALSYKLPGDADDIDLMSDVRLYNSTIIFPSSDMTFLSEGMNRGLKVNIFEKVVENFKEKETIIPKVIFTFSYLTDDEIDRNSNSIKNALVQIQVEFFGRKENIQETLTFNFYNFDTEVKDKRAIFDIRRCFKNEDDYLWVTIGFNADKSQLALIRKNVPSIQDSILGSIQSTSELTPVRVPIILVDVQDGLYVTLQILGKPPVLNDFLPPEKGKTLEGGKDTDSVQDIEDCATKCLEEEDNCVAFSFCGAICSFASDKVKEVKSDKCELYKRYSDVFIQSKELIVQNIRGEVESESPLALVLVGLQDEAITLYASSIEVNEPGEDDRMINRLGNKPNSRMRVFKNGAKLLSGVEGVPVKNLGKLRFDECQRECLDYEICETVSYCLKGECILSTKFAEEIDEKAIEDDNLCVIVTRKYGDLFNRSPGNVLSVTAREVLNLTNLEQCARACLQSSDYQCLSFDHCPQSNGYACKLHTVHYPNSNTRETIQVRDTNCGHYFKKFSTEFKRIPNKRHLDATIEIKYNTLEECAKNCVEYKEGTCFGFDFCQDDYMTTTRCVILDKDPSQLRPASSPACTNFLRGGEISQAPPPGYTTGYAGGIGFLCFFVGLAVGVLVLFGVAYFRVNTH